MNSVIDAEIQKPISEMNPDLIEEYVEWALEIEGRQVEDIPKEEIRRITKSIGDKYYRPLRRKLLNIFTVVAACIAIILSIQLVSMTAFHENLCIPRI